jgi:hypothetical protein
MLPDRKDRISKRFLGISEMAKDQNTKQRRRHGDDEKSDLRLNTTTNFEKSRLITGTKFFQKEAEFRGILSQIDDQI